jgi:ABC-2 type transport system ATP-binding protein
VNVTNSPADAASAGGDSPAVSVNGLRHSFGDTKAVDGVDLHVEPGEIFGLLGPNGAGKTTTIRLVTTLLPARPGMVAVYGLDVTRRKTAVRRLIGYVPQQLSVEGGLTGRQNVALFARLFDVPRRQRAGMVDEVLTSMGLSEAADRLAGTYSGGMVRRLELAQALISSPRLLILDEPTIGLDPVARVSVWERICAVRDATGMTVLITTHYMDEADRYCDRIALMHRGRIRALGTPAELKSGLDHDETTLDDVFRAYTGDTLEETTTGGFRDVRTTRRTASRLG